MLIYVYLCEIYVKVMLIYVQQQYGNSTLLKMTQLSRSKAYLLIEGDRPAESCLRYFD